MAADSVDFSPFSKRELSSLAKTFTTMGDNSVDSAKRISYEIASLAQNKIRQAGYSRTKSGKAVRRVVDGSTVSRTSKTGRLSFGFAGQRFSGGASTQKLWGGLEFGSDRFKQFPSWSGRYGRGSRGWFIYPTLRQIQPELTLKWMKEVNQIVKDWKD